MQEPTNKPESIDPTDVDIHPNTVSQETWEQTFYPDGASGLNPGVVPLSVGNDGRLIGNSPSTPPIAITLPRTSVEGAEWVFSGTFSPTDADTMAWGSGTLTTEDGHTYAIGAGNTGNMATKTYVYFDVDVSTTAFQTTTTAGNSVGSGKILIAVAQNATGEAKYMVLNDNQYNLDAANIVANSITANELATSITYAGSIIIDSAGLIRSGQTAYNIGTGWWIGNDSGTPKLSIGVSTGDSMTWDGLRLRATGTVNFNIPLTTYQEFAGATTPVPVYVNSLGFVQVSDANVAQKAKFIGFASSTTSNLLPAFVNTGTGTSTSFSATANAGTNRILVVQVGAVKTSGGGNVTMPTAITWGGSSLTILDSDKSGDNNYGQVIAYRVIGTSGSNQAQTLALTGGTFDEMSVTYSTFQYVDQATPIGSSNQATGNSTTPSSTITPSVSSSQILTFVMSGSDDSTVSWGDGLVTFASETASSSSLALFGGQVSWHLTGSNAFDATVDNGNWLCMAMELIGASTTVSVRVNGSQDGFTGLSIGSVYYISDTEGVLATSAGSTSLPVGKAITATELIIIQPSV